MAAVQAETQTMTEAVAQAYRMLCDGADAGWLLCADPSRVMGPAAEWETAVDPGSVHVFEPEEHLFAEVVCCVSGSFSLQVHDSWVEMTQGRACALLPGAVHREQPAGQCYTALWMSLDYGRLVIGLSGRTEEHSFVVWPALFIRPGIELMALVEDMRREMERNDVFSLQIIKTLVLRLLLNLQRSLKAYGGDPQGNSNWKETVIDEITAYIRGNYAAHIRLADMAQMACISPNYLNTLFKAQTGRTIAQYHEDVRMEAAKGMLLGGSASIGEIAEKLGYYDQYHFSKIFKKATGLSPAAFRKSAHSL